MVLEKATDIRKEWSAACDMVVREKPIFFKRTRDHIWMSNMDVMRQILDAYGFSAQRLIEDDGSVTLSLNEIDIVENGKDEAEALGLLGEAILEYSEDYYKEFSLYSNAPNRKAHIPYVFKALIIGDGKTIGGMIKCQDSEKTTSGNEGVF